MTGTRPASSRNKPIAIRGFGMGIDLSIRIGGEAGQGIQTVGHLLAQVSHKAGLYVMVLNDYESRVRGGHSFIQIRISDRLVSAPDHRTHLLVALNRETYDIHREDLEPGALVLIEGEEDLTADNILRVPILELARKSGGKITANTIAAGAGLSLLGAPFALLKDVLAEQFSRKGKEVVEKNVLAAELGYEAVKDTSFKWSFPWKEDQPKGMLLDGSRAIALGALAGDCRVAAFYPMSPATGIMAQLSRLSDNFPLVVEQVEDEIAAVNMIVGASFAGARAMTSTSGGGFCLMTEGLGLAAITETPVVIVNAQRPGPATGLPTRTAQGDLQFAISASQDEFPRFVFAPGTVAEAFEITARAFHLSEKYQVPAIILVDHFFTSTSFIAERPLVAPPHIERFIVQDNDMADPRAYQRFSLTPSGVSPRALPCKGEALVLVSGNEHREDGHISEAISDRINMVNKRKSKLPAMMQEMNPPKAYHGEADLLLLGWGATSGAIREGVDILREEGLEVGSLNFTDMWPFPGDEARKALGKKKFFVVEENSTGQFGLVLRQQTGLEHSGAILKYDGRSFFPYEIAEGLREYMR